MDASPPLSGYRIPGWLLAVYAVLFTLLGWSGAGLWAAYRTHPVPRAAPVDFSAALMIPSAITDPARAAAPVCADGELMPLIYSAHVYADEPPRRSVTFNGRQYHEGDKLACGAEIVQIQQALAVLQIDGHTLWLDALEDWPGGPPRGEGEE